MTPLVIPEQLSGQQYPEYYLHMHYSSEAITRKSQISVHGHLFSFMLEGNKEIHFQEEIVRVRTGQALLIGAGNCLMTDRASAEMHYRTMLLFFSAARLNAMTVKYPGLFGSHDASSAGGPPARKPCFLLEQDNYVRHIMDGLQQAYGSGVKTQTDLLPLLLEELMVYLAHQHPESFAGFVAGLMGPSPDKDLTRVVENNLYNSLTQEELAFLCHMSLSTFKRRFEQTYGMPPIRWFHERRMERAALLLRQEQRKATEIHEELGYEDLSSFIQAFKKEYGVTPKTYQGQV